MKIAEDSACIQVSGVQIWNVREYNGNTGEVIHRKTVTQLAAGSSSFSTHPLPHPYLTLLLAPAPAGC